MNISFWQYRSSFIAFLSFALMVLFTASITPSTTPVTDVVTYHNDNFRSGHNLHETILTPAKVNQSTFGKLFEFPVDSAIDAQPLYLSAVPIGAATPNVVYAVTENDSVYAFDADTGATYWHVSLLPSGETPSDIRNCAQVTPTIGITATPVIDRKSGPHGTIYVVAMSKDSSNNYFQRLHALDVTTGAEEFGGPVAIAAQYPGNGDNSQNGMVIFDPKQYKERPGLLLLNNVIYTAWSSHCDYRPYTGWLIGYSESTLAQTSVLNVTPNGNEGAIWQSGGGMAAAGNNIFFLEANGTFDTTLNSKGFPSQGDYGNSFMKISTTNNQLAVADYFTMHNTVSESNSDTDLGSGGAMVLPPLKDSTGKLWNLAIGAGKDQNIYIVNRNNLGKFSPANDNAIYQEIDGVLKAGVWAMPAYFNGNVYFGPQENALMQFQFSNAKLPTSPTHQTTTAFTYPGTTPSVSANGLKDAIVWAIEHSSPSVLHAYDADNVATEFYNSNQNSSRDQFGDAGHFETPTIANGKVFVGTTSSVAVFGLLH